MRNGLPVVVLSLLALSVPALAYVGLVTVAERQEVAVTIYNSEDLTLVRERRNVVLKQGVNPLRFAWAGTLIDPTSLQPFAPPGARLLDTTYPLDEGESLVWALKAERQVSGPLSIQYFTSGLTWHADHVLVLGADRKAELQTWINVLNNSGEDYADTHFRLVVGEVRLQEKIRDIALRFKAEGASHAPQPKSKHAEKRMMKEMEDSAVAKAAGGRMGKKDARAPKEVERESLSELHLYSIEGTESVANGGGRRMRAFATSGVGVKDVYRCVDPEGRQPASRVLTFRNHKDNHLGVQPLPEGVLQVYREHAGTLRYDGRGALPYTPMGEEAETPLGTVEGVSCEAWRKGFLHENARKDTLGRVVGWEDVTTWEVKLINGSGTAVVFELRQHHDAPFSSSLTGASKEDVRTLFLRQEMQPFEHKLLRYQVTVRRGELARESSKEAK